MSRVLLDTSAYSAFMRGDVAVKERLQTADATYLNPVVLGSCGLDSYEAVPGRKTKNG